MAQYIIETRQLTKTYRGTPAVDHLDLRIPEGSIFGFLGPNGAGKSTTMKMLLGLINRDSGSIRINGTELNDHSRISILRQVGSLIETPSYYGNLTAYENLQISCMLRGLPYTEIDRVLSIVRLDGQKKKQAANYSLGMKQRLGLALALVGGPDLLLLDEPFNGLDPESTRAMRGALVRLNRERGVTMVISSHVLDQLDRMATSFGVIRSGRMVRELSMDDLHRECGNSIRIRTNDPARTLAILEEALPGTALRAEPDGSILASAAVRHAATSFGGAAVAPMVPSAEDVARALSEHGLLILELSHVERDIEEYFVELMGGADA